MKVLRDVFTPNKTVSQEVRSLIIFGQALFVLVVWWLFPIAMIPKLPQVLGAFGTLWNEGILVDLAVSFFVNLKALICTMIISLSISYLTVVPFMRPPAEGVAKLRFLGFVGLTLPFTLIFGGGEPLKIAVLTFFMTAYFVTSMSDEVASIPREKFDHARTLRMREWRVVWEVVIRGKLDRVFEVTRQVAGMGWMMVTLVEGIVRSDGGVGAVLISKNKMLDKLPEVFAILIIIVIVGILQDKAIRGLMKVMCPWATLSLERK